MMENTAKIYLDDTKLIDFGIEKQKPKNIHHINEEAVDWYENYFNRMMSHFTFQIRMKGGELHYVFSEVEIDEWETRVKSRFSIQATRYLDKIHMENITIHNILSVRDVSKQVRHQYEEQRQIIFNSYALVEQIMEYHHSPFVQEMIEYVEASRRNDESKRKFWRVVNEKYYGLDIHPLMEYEEDELHKILYYCKNPQEQKMLHWVPILKASAASGATILASWLTYSYFFTK